MVLHVDDVDHLLTFVIFDFTAVMIYLNEHTWVRVYPVSYVSSVSQDIEDGVKTFLMGGVVNEFRLLAFLIIITIFQIHQYRNELVLEELVGNNCGKELWRSLSGILLGVSYHLTKALYRLANVRIRVKFHRNLSSYSSPVDVTTYTRSISKQYFHLIFLGIWYCLENERLLNLLDLFVFQLSVFELVIK